ncbi:hypothetical protein QVD17_21294 [Tagetes erecta]|uniref:Morc S5 domain-containing protein n=1 Tax=Tagetes erecta TaxID=13708 RepID=A0AAD8NYU8_TARER|nr:hypothetical protein QVD17_21294 [Tagetes erecta]
MQTTKSNMDYNYYESEVGSSSRPPYKKPKIEYQLYNSTYIPAPAPAPAPPEQVGSTSSTMLCKQFWKAGDYDPPAAAAHSLGGMDHLRVHPRFLHSNATSHKWALGAFAELLDNSLDEVHTGATYVNVDVLNNDSDNRNKMLLVEDNGGGMSPDNMRRCMSLGYSVKSKVANTIGQYGNGFKTSTMRLGADVLVFTRCPGQHGSRPTQSIGMLSYTYLMETGKDDIVVPMIDFEKRGEEWVMINSKSSHADWERNKETIVRWSPYSTQQCLLQQDQGTRIIIYNLWEDEEGQLELDFDTNKDSYAAILYLRIPNGFKVILRGKDVNHHNIIDDMMLTEKPMSTEVTLGFVKDAKDHIDVQGFNVYHKNRLIKPFWRVWNAAGSDGRGVIGVLEANFVEPAHDKQEFERTSVLSRLENRLIVIQKKYWSTNCQEIGYAKRCKTASVTKCKPSIESKSGENKVLNAIDATKVKLRPIRKQEASKPVEFAQNDQQAYASTAAATGNGNGSYMIPKLREENHELRQRLESSESVMINNLLLDLRSERDKNVFLENQVVKSQEAIEKLDQEQVNLIAIFSEERQRRDEMEEALRSKLKEAQNTIEELRRQIN